MKFKMITGISIASICFSWIVAACGAGDQHRQIATVEQEDKMEQMIMDDMDTATLGAGCFWCVEAVFQELRGVVSVTSGYAGGFVEDPTYKEVCAGQTGHAEVARIVYDPEQLTFDDLLEVFWKTHDPTTLNRQGNDVGTQYRSVVFYHNDEQRKKAEFYKEKLDGSGAYDRPVVTTIEALNKFYAADDYHQNYYKNNSSQPYCAFVIQPKLDKFREAFAEKLK